MAKIVYLFEEPAFSRVLFDPWQGVQDELQQRDAERQRMRQHTKDVKDECDQHFQRELRRMRRGQKTMAKELLEKQSMRLADAYESWWMVSVTF